jgi:hypothetical protein
VEGNQLVNFLGEVVFSKGTPNNARCPKKFPKGRKETRAEKEKEHPARTRIRPKGHHQEAKRADDLNEQTIFSHQSGAWKINVVRLQMQEH